MGFEHVPISAFVALVLEHSMSITHSVSFKHSINLQQVACFDHAAEL